MIKAAERLMGAQLKHASLLGQENAIAQQAHKLTASIGIAKARLDMAPEVSSVFEYMQEKVHERAVGEFEALLTAFVQDVVPNAGEIRLELGTARGAPSLDVLVDNGGDLENILEGNGGGLTNVVVTGLAFSALSRTSNRQLLVLDEPDCWLKSNYIPAFTRVIAQVANEEDPSESGESGIQTLMISHNDVSLMDEGACIQELRNEVDLEAYAANVGLPIEIKGEPSSGAYVYWAPKKGSKGKLVVEYRDDMVDAGEQNALTKGYPVVDSIEGARSFLPSQTGIRWVEVKNVRHHVFTRLELSPGLNVLAGDINSGKSTLYLTALRVLAYGEADDTMIRHGARSAIIRVGLENGVELEVERYRSGTPKMEFRRYKNGKLTNEGPALTRSAVPEFIEKELNIRPVDGLDIQLRSQKQPIFLLNETPARRARLLSVGKEAGLLQNLIEAHRLSVRRDRELLKREEMELALLNKQLAALRPLSSLSSLIPLLSGMQEEIKEGQRTQEALSTLSEKFYRLSRLVQVASVNAVEGLQVPAIPKLNEVDTLAALQPRLEQLERKSQLSKAVLAHNGPKLPATPKLADVEVLAKITTTLPSLQKKVQLPTPPAAPTAPNIEQGAREERQLQGLVGKIQKGAQLAKLGQAVITELPPAPVIKEAENLISSLALIKARIESLQKGQKALKEIKEQVSAEAKAMDALKVELGSCPTCHQLFEGH